MFELTSDEGVCQRGEVSFILGIEEQVVAGLGIEQRLMAVHTRAVDTVHRLGHERSDEPMLGSDRLHRVLKRQNVICSLERVREAEVNFMLTERHFVMTDFYVESHLVEGIHQRSADDNGFIER